MAIERNFTGWEMGDLGELRFGTGGSLSLTSIVDDATARSGRFHFRQTASGGGSSLCYFPAGTIVGTSGTVTSGNHKRVSVRAYLRVESGGIGANANGQQRIIGFGDDNGTCNVFFGAQNTSGGFVQPGSKLGLRIGTQSHSNVAGAYPWSTVDLTVGVWYRLLLEIDLDVQATTVLSASLRVTEDSASPSVDFTLTNTLNIGATDNIDRLALGYSSAPGAFGRQATVQFDDLVYVATSDADAASSPTLVTQTHIYAIVPPTGVALNQWSGTYTDVDEYPASATDTMSSSTAAAEVDFTHATGLALGYSEIQAMKLYVNALVSGAGTGLVDYLLNGTAKAATLGANYPSVAAGADPVGGVLFSTMTAAAFGATTFGIRKNNGTQATVMANIGLEVIGTLAAFGSGNQIRGETQIKRGSIYDAQIADGAAIARHKIAGLGGGSLPVFFPEEEGRDDWMIPGPPGAAAASVRIPVVPVFFPDDPPDEALLMAQTAGTSSGGGGSTTNNNYYVGGLVLLAELTAAASSSLDFILRNAANQSGAIFQSDFDQYIIEIVGLVPATDNVDLRLRCSTDGGATFDSGANYGYALRSDNQAFNAVAGGDSGQSQIVLAGGVDTTTAQGSVNLTAKVFGPLSTALYKTFTIQGMFHSNDTHYYSLVGEGHYLSASAINAIRLILSSGNITSGVARIYGITKTATSVPSSQSFGGHVLLSEQVASASSALSFATRNVAGQSGALFQGDYDEYIVELLNILPATDNVDLLLRYSTDGGASYVSAANYDYADFINNVANFSTASVSATGATSSKIIPTQDNTAANGGACASLKFFAPLNAAQHKHLTGSFSWWNNDNQFYNGTLSFRFATTTAINAFQLFYSSGNIASGTVRVYGLSKTAMSQQIAPAHGLVLIGQQTVSGVAQVDFVSRNVGSLSGAIFQSDYDEYVFEFVNVIPATNGVTLSARVSTDGGATFDSGNNYRHGFTFSGSQNTGGTSGSNSESSIPFAGTASNSASGGGANGTFRIYNPLSAVQQKIVTFLAGFLSNDGNYYHIHGSGVYNQTTAVNAIRFLQSSGNLSGTIRCYGVVKDATYPVSTIQTGTHASRPSAGNAGRIYLPNDGYSIGRDSGTAWATFGPVYPFTLPSDSGFSWVNQGGASLDTSKDALTVTDVASGAVTAIRGRAKTAPATPYTITAYMHSNLLYKDFGAYGLFWRDSASGKIVTFWLVGATAAGCVDLMVQKYTDASTFSATYQSIHAAKLNWLRIKDDGANRICYFSEDGQNWTQFHSIGRTDFLTADQIGFCGQSLNNLTPNFGYIWSVLSWKQE